MQKSVSVPLPIRLVERQSAVVFIHDFVLVLPPLIPLISFSCFWYIRRGGAHAARLWRVDAAARRHSAFGRLPLRLLFQVAQRTRVESPRGRARAPAAEEGRGGDQEERQGVGGRGGGGGRVAVRRLERGGGGRRCRRETQAGGMCIANLERAIDCTLDHSLSPHCDDLDLFPCLSPRACLVGRANRPPARRPSRHEQQKSEAVHETAHTRAPKSRSYISQPASRSGTSHFPQNASTLTFSSMHFLFLFVVFYPFPSPFV